MTFLKSKEDRKKAQQSKLLSEFPWLWNIRNQWKLGFDDISVTRLRVPKNMWEILELESIKEVVAILKKKPRDQVEIWIYQENGDTTSITKMPNTTEAESNLDSIDLTVIGQSEIKALAVVTTTAISRTSTEIYLPHKSMGTLNEWIERLQIAASEKAEEANA